MSNIDESKSEVLTNKSKRKDCFNWLKTLFLRFKRCSHEFAIDNIKLTGIPLIPVPDNNAGYVEWQKYHEEFYECEGNIKRVSSVCRKCGKEFFASCGLELPGHLVGADK